MTLASGENAQEQTSGSTTYGSGGAEPYAAALRNEAGALYLISTPLDIRPMTSFIDVGRWSAGADDADLSLLDGVTAPVLDIGCGPGRMVRAAADRGLSALGIDVSPTAVQIAVESGLSVLNRSVFDRIPLEGYWATALLLDGNIGIGGNPGALLDRCVELLTSDGVLLVEVSSDPSLDYMYDGKIQDAAGRQSDSFPWAEIGIAALRSRADAAGLAVVQDWRVDDRWFARLVRTSMVRR